MNKRLDKFAGSWRDELDTTQLNGYTLYFLTEREHGVIPVQRASSDRGCELVHGRKGRGPIFLEFDLLDGVALPCSLYRRLRKIPAATSSHVVEYEGTVRMSSGRGVMAQGDGQGSPG